MGVRVRDAMLGDAEAIAAINIASWQAAYRGIVPDVVLARMAADPDRAIERWRTIISEPLGPQLVACDEDGPVVGYCCLACPARDGDADGLTGEITAVYVDPRWFHAGIGAALMEEALTRLRFEGWGEVLLWVLSENQRARAFYGHHGFIPDGAVQWLDRLEAEEMRLRRAL